MLTRALIQSSLGIILHVCRTFFRQRKMHSGSTSESSLSSSCSGSAAAGAADTLGSTEAGVARSRFLELIVSREEARPAAQTRSLVSGLPLAAPDASGQEVWQHMGQRDI